MLAGDFMFALNDAMGKWLVASFSVGQVVLIRSIGAFIVLGPMIAHQGAGKLFQHGSARNCKSCASSRPRSTPRSSMPPSSICRLPT